MIVAPVLHNWLLHLALLAAVLLAGCAATSEQKPIPASILQAPAGNLQLVEAMGQPERHLGTAVRWGGSVITLRAGSAGSTEVEILERRLDDQGRPLDSSPSDGRFLIRAADSVDAGLYRLGSLVTVAWIFQRMEHRQVGNSSQPLALVEVSDFIQWEEPYPSRYDYYQPYYGRPYYGRPYYGRPYYFPNFHLGIGISN